MRHTTGHLRGWAGVSLHHQVWVPAGTPGAMLAIVHGFGEHSGRYAGITAEMVARGYAVAAFDLRGHGQSGGRRGFIRSWAEYRHDVGVFLSTVREGAPQRRTFLMGHSMGGLIVLDYALHRPKGLSGVIASAPVLGQIGVSPLRLHLSRVLSRVSPTFSLEAGLDLEALSRDPAVVEAYRQDRLVHGRATARLATELAATVGRVQAQAPHLRVPLLIVHGEADRIASPEGSRLFFERVTYPDKERYVYAGGYHEPHNDLEHARVVGDIAGWMERHLAPAQDEVSP
ncbi:MAG: alpha/beta hydrolase [Chloroflexota bacterium]